MTRKLFDGMHHCRVAIIMSRRTTGSGAASVGTTRYHKWYRDERPHLFSSIRFLIVDTERFDDWVPKFRSRAEISAYEKLCQCRKQIGDLISATATDFRIYYKITGVAHWFAFTLEPPRFWRDGVEARSTRENSVCFPNAVVRDTVFCCLWSTLCYWIYQARTNCRDFNPADIAYLPITDAIAAGLPNAAKLSASLAEELDRNSAIGTGNYAVGGAIRFQKFRPKLSKATIDKIDRMLAPHYGLNSDELDFIINYDIKYRMGGGDDNDRK